MPVYFYRGDKTTPINFMLNDQKAHIPYSLSYRLMCESHLEVEQARPV